VKVKRLPSGKGLPLPTRMTAQAAGFDLSAAVPEAVVLRPGDIRLVPCGRHGVTLVNSPGTIDSDYRGEVQVPLINLGRADFTVERGMRVAQMLVLPVPPVRLMEVDELDATDRGAGGFGHTGHQT
jgi:dUTP pyrophosphatase